MTKPASTIFVGDLGVTAVRRCCARAGQLFREVVFGDVGLDAFIEVVLNGAATGILIGVQVKAGPSFVKGDKFRLPADPEHVRYWRRCPLPVIGVVHDIDGDRSVWIDLKADLAGAQYTYRAAFGPETTFTAEALTARVIPSVVDAHLLFRARSALTSAPGQSTSHGTKPMVKHTKTAHDEWRSLLDTLTSPAVTDAARLQAAHSLSWHNPAVSKAYAKELVHTVTGLSNLQFASVLRAAALAWNSDASHISELILDLLAYDPRSVGRVENMVLQRMLPEDNVEPAIQAVEYFEQRERADLRALIKPGDYVLRG